MKKKQKETSMQKEIDHRIKNNLNIVSSILGLQISSLQNGLVYNTADILKKSKLRVDTLAMIHDLSSKCEDLINIDFKEFVKRLCDLVNTNYNSNLEVEIRADKVDVSLDTMLRIGIIINELLTNSLKYAFFYKKSEKKILITLKKDENSCILTYHEKGVNLVNIAKIKDSQALGFRLVMLTLKQMRAHMSITQDGGLKFAIDFKC